MPKFKVCATNIEYLLTTEVEAKDCEEAVEKYIEMWDNGYIDVNDSELVDCRAEEIN